MTMITANRDIHNEELRDIFVRQGLRTKLGTCDMCQVLLPYENWSKYVYWLADGGQDLKRFKQLIDENFGVEFLRQLGRQEIEHPREIFVQLMLEPCKKCGTRVCAACRSQQGLAMTCLDCPTPA